MKKIISLSNVFIKEFYQNLDVFDNKKNKFNKKSIFFWLIAIIFVGITYVSFEIIKFLTSVGRPEKFLNIYFLILAVLLIFQTILVCANVFFFSKDIEKVLHMPIKATQLLASKLITLLCMLYATEAVFSVVPLTLYGLMTNAHLLFYFWEIIILFIFPVLFAVIISTLMLIIMRVAKFIKNKDIFQIFITLILVAGICVLEFKISQGIFTANNDEQALQQLSSMSEKSQEVGKYFLVINPVDNMLTSPASFSAIWSFIKLVLANIIGIAVFMLIGKVTYLRDLLRNMVSYSKKKKVKIDIKKSTKTHSKARTYVTKEVKSLIKEPIFFMQCVFPVMIILITCIILGIVIFPIAVEIMQYEEIKQVIQSLSFNTEAVCDILIVLQVLFSISNISLTAISRDGKNAIFIKYIPIELYRQFVYKNIPQIALNLLISVVVLAIIWYLIPSLNALYIVGMLIIATIINFINSYLMLIVDLRRPNLNWDTAYSVVKRSDNKLFQYVLMIVNVLFLMYIANILQGISIIVAIGIEILIFAIIFVIIDRCVKRWQDKLFNKII